MFKVLHMTALSTTLSSGDKKHGAMGRQYSIFGCAMEWRRRR